jgi:hypothetical protein
MLWDRLTQWRDPFWETLTWHCLKAEKLASLLDLPDDLAFGLASRLVSISELPPKTQRQVIRRITNFLDEILDTAVSGSETLRRQTQPARHS